MLDAYDVQLPPGDWFDYWTGTKIDRTPHIASRDAEQPLTGTQPVNPLHIKPSLEALPVYVRGGTILPTQPLVQSTSEIPKGPLTLRVYAADNCHGTVYQDDGISFSFRNGAYLRMDSTCTVSNDGLQIHIGEHQGSYQPWWTNIAVEVHGWRPQTKTATVNGKSIPIISSTSSITFTVPDTGKGIDAVLK
jgi:alpha-glucosidase